MTGTCSYPHKALAAQQLGAQGILFSYEKMDRNNPDQIIYEDDGSGKKVKIASLFITPESMTELKGLKNV